jgi:crotonobetainyl-CoA:carnitine CoA-transferase CaiB-like acyl-CoA transferase
LLVRPGWPGFRAPTSFYTCSDGYVNLRLQGVEMPFLAYLLDMPELADDPRFQTLEERTQNIKALEEIVGGKLAGMSKKDVFRTAGEWRALCGYVATPEDLLTDPQYQAREFWADIDHPVAGKQTYPGAPVKMTETEWRNRRAPLLGEHNLEIYCGRLGYTKDDLVRLRASGII